MPIYIFHRKIGFTPVNLRDDKEAISTLKDHHDVSKIEFAPTGKIIWEREAKPKPIPQYEYYGTPFLFSIGDLVSKKAGYKFDGEVRAAFTTRKGEIRYAIELVTEPAGGNGDCMIHIFSENQLEKE